jgi:hypothetical protein
VLYVKQHIHSTQAAKTTTTKTKQRPYTPVVWVEHTVLYIQTTCVGTQSKKAQHIASKLYPSNGIM